MSYKRVVRSTFAPDNSFFLYIHKAIWMLIYTNNDKSLVGKKPQRRKGAKYMALTRKFLTALGLEGDKIDEIIDAHSETVSALKKERDDAKDEARANKAEAETYKVEAEKAAGLQKEVDELKKAAKEAEKSENKDSWKLKYDAMKEERDKLQGEFDSYKNEITSKETKAAKEKAYRSLLKEAGVSENRIDSVIRVTDLEGIELDEEGSVKDSSAVKKSIKEEWADFIPTKTEKGATTATPPANNGGGRMTKEQIDAIEDTTERQKAMFENRDLYGIV